MKKLAVTGCSGYIGGRLMERLEEAEWVDRVLGIDIRPPAKWWKKMDFHPFDVRDPKLTELLSGERPEVLVHLAFIVNPLRDEREMHDIDVRGTENVLRAAAEAGVRHLVIASSSSAFGAFPDNPEWLTEDHPPRRMPNYTYASDKYEVEMLVKRFMEDNPHVKVAVIRPCIVYGPNVNNYLSRFILRLPFIPSVDGQVPQMQFVHEDDVAEVFLKVIEGEAAGYFHACGEGTVGIDEIAAMAGKPLLKVPARIAYPLVDLLWRTRFPLVEGPSGMLDFIRYRWTISDQKTREALGLGPRRSSREAVEEMLRTHRAGKRGSLLPGRGKAA
ncbi:MAG: NAD-dependent epimerase/dehydratase family protein [Candidatus Geothermincolales bacterium]